MTQPRSSLAIALQDYKGIRPGIALTIAAVALIGAIVVGLIHVVRLGAAAASIENAGQTIRTMHRYDATLEVWRQMAAEDAATGAQARMRDSLAMALRADLANLMDATPDSADRNLLGAIVRDLTPAASGASGVDITSAGREEMILLRGRQDSVLFAAAAASQRAQLIGALLIGLTVIAAGILIIPMSWVYVRYKRGVPPGM